VYHGSRASWVAPSRVISVSQCPQMSGYCRTTASGHGSATASITATPITAASHAQPRDVRERPGRAYAGAMRSHRGGGSSVVTSVRCANRRHRRNSANGSTLWTSPTGPLLMSDMPSAAPAPRNASQ
jgi:hypothetical protein